MRRHDVSTRLERLRDGSEPPSFATGTRTAFAATPGNKSSPGLANDDVAKLVVPVPDLAVQESIVAEVRRRRERARMLRAKAEQGWTEAKRWFEAQLLGPAP